MFCIGRYQTVPGSDGQPSNRPAILAIWPLSRMHRCLCSTSSFGNGFHEIRWKYAVRVGQKSLFENIKPLGSKEFGNIFLRLMLPNRHYGPVERPEGDRIKLNSKLDNFHRFQIDIQFQWAPSKESLKNSEKISRNNLDNLSLKFFEQHEKLVEVSSWN